MQVFVAFDEARWLYSGYFFVNLDRRFSKLCRATHRDCIDTLLASKKRKKHIKYDAAFRLGLLLLLLWIFAFKGMLWPS